MEVNRLKNNFSNNEKPVLLIIGAGIVGLTIAREADKRNIFGKIIIIDKEKTAGYHATTRNSGVIHSGFYYTPESNKAKFCAEGNKLMREYCIKKSIQNNKCGKVVISKNQKEDEVINELGRRAKINNSKVEILYKEELKNYEPSAITNNVFLWSPNTWSASPKQVLSSLLEELKIKKVQIKLNAKIKNSENDHVILEGGEKIKFNVLVNAAGGYALKISELFGLKSEYKTLPFKGLYLKSRKKITKFKRHIYPVPDINQPFLGIHTTITSDNYLKLGPTAIPVLSPENYSFLELNSFESFCKTDVRSNDSVILVFLLCNSTSPELASLPETILQGIPMRSASLNFIPALSSLSSISASTPHSINFR